MAKFLLERSTSTVVLRRWATACKSGGPHLGILMHKLATARMSGGPRTSVYFGNGFACRIRLKNSDLYEQSYGHPVNWRGNNFFFGDQLD